MQSIMFNSKCLPTPSFISTAIGGRKIDNNIITSLFIVVLALGGLFILKYRSNTRLKTRKTQLLAIKFNIVADNRKARSWR